MLKKAKEFLNKELNYTGDEVALHLVTLIEDEINTAKKIGSIEGYNIGYDDGYEDGYTDAINVNKHL